MADWNFTPEDYGKLVQKGGDLGYDADSDWLPQELKDNLKITLKQVLDPKTNKRNTAGVNTKDFYHGHVVCPKPCGDECKAARKEYKAANKTATESIDKLGKITKDNVDKLKEAVAAEAKAATAALKNCLKSGCGVVYHTYEVKRPPELKDKPNDPRTNLFTPNGGTKAEEFTAPTKSDGSSFEDENNYQNKYCLLLQFAFLIDKNGKIHVVPGTFDRLPAVTGP